GDGGGDLLGAVGPVPVSDGDGVVGREPARDDPADPAPAADDQRTRRRGRVRGAHSCPSAVPAIEASSSGPPCTALRWRWWCTARSPPSSSPPPARPGP